MQNTYCKESAVELQNVEALIGDPLNSQ